MNYDVAIIGSGPGGYVAALHGAQSGARVCCIEMNDVGGTCLNKGCIPTKYLIAAADKLKKAGELENFGLTLGGELLWKKVLEGKGKVVGIQARGIEGLFKSWGVTLVRGRASFLNRTTLRVEGDGQAAREIRASRIIVASGSSPSSIPGVTCDGTHILNSDHILDLERIPGHLLIIGAGAIGCEFANLFRRLGSRVTLVEMLPRPLPLEDAGVSSLFARELRKRQVVLHVGARIASLAREDGGVRARLDGGEEISADIALVATGRKKNTPGLGLDAAGLDAIAVNERMETAAQGIYAVGDVVGRKMLAHVASREGIVAMDNALGKPASMDYRVIPSTTFTDPEVASVGLTEEQAVSAHGDVAVGRFPFRALGKAHVIGEIAGEVKIVAGGRDRTILGAHIIGPHSTEIIHELALAVLMKATLRDLSDLIHAHPTLSEALGEAASAAHGNAVHLPKERGKDST